MGDVVTRTPKPRDPPPSPADVMRVAETIGAVTKALGPDEAIPDGVIPLSRLEVLYTRAVVTLCGGSKALAAKSLGVTRRAVYRVLEREATAG